MAEAALSNLILLLLSAAVLLFAFCKRHGLYSRRKRKIIACYILEGAILGIFFGILLACVHICPPISSVCLCTIAGTAIGMNIVKDDE